MAFNDQGQFSQGQFPQAMYAAPTRSNPSRRFWILAVLLLIMALICFLLIQGDVAFPGLYFWFIGGDIMQFWFIVLVILGLVYLRYSRVPQKSSAGGFPQRSDPYGYAGNFGSFSTQQPRRASPMVLLLRLPLVLLLVFLIYYFFIQGYTFRINPNPTIMGDCNAGSITIVGNATSNQVSLNAGLTTIEGYGNYDQGSNTLNINGNLCGFTISVPAASHLNISGNDAEISVTGIKGKIEVDNNAGNITINGSRLLAGSVVTNNGGDITINHSCLLDNSDIENNGGAITITNSNVSSSAKVDINGGSPTITNPITDGCNV